MLKTKERQPAIRTLRGWAISVRLQRHLVVINTGTTIVTFLMVFLIQATENRDTLAVQLKLDELILATKDARNHLAGIEEAPDAEIEQTKIEVLKRAG